MLTILSWRGQLSFYLYRFWAYPLAWILLQGFRWFLPPKVRELIRLKNENIFYKRSEGPNFSFERIKKNGEIPLPSNLLIWIHAASGEIEYARPLFRAIKTTLPKAQILVTHTSPSSISILQSLPEIDFWGPAPWDCPSGIKTFLNQWKPKMVLFARTDVWPETIWQCRRQAIPSLLFSATFADNSSRLRGPGKYINEFCLLQLHGIDCVSVTDVNTLQNRLPLLIKTPTRVAGDTRFDQVSYRLKHPKPLPRVLQSFLSGPVFVGGSTWPEDEVILTEVLAILVNKGWKFIWAPHEVEEAHLQKIKKTLRSLDLPYILFSKIENTPPHELTHHNVLLVDQIGYLAELYTLGMVAFVGGSFRKQVHSVMEPLAAGLPVLIGPQHRNNREAMEFQNFSVGRGNLKMVTVIHTPLEILNFFAAWTMEMDQDNSENEQGTALHQQIQSMVQNQEGATKLAMDWICSQIK